LLLVDGSAGKPEENPARDWPPPTRRPQAFDVEVTINLAFPAIATLRRLRQRVNFCKFNEWPSAISNP
jgi:hypothetical protein